MGLNLRSRIFVGFVLLVGVFQVEAEHQITEAEQMALEVSEVMLPPKKLSRMIDEHLKAIRKLYPEMESIHHSPKWVAGELIVTTRADNTIQNINSSRYGPIKTVERVTTEPESEMGLTYKLMFAKPYHPARLSERMRTELGIQEVEGNLIFGDGNDVSYHATAPTYYTYTFKMGWGDCTSGCIYKHYWEYTVAPTQETLTVKLEKEYGSDLKYKNFP